MDIRTQLVEKIKARFQAITVANGCGSDLGLNVFNWRKTAMDPGSIPGLVFRDEDARLNLGERGDDEVPIGMWEHHLKVPVDVHFTGTTSADDARQALTDVVAAVFPPERRAQDGTLISPADRVGRWDGLAERTELIGHAINTAQEGEIICGAHLILLIVYQTPLGTL